MGVLDGKVSVVIGGAGPLSSAFARALALAGSKVLVNDINGDGVKKVVEDIKSFGGEAVANTDNIGDWGNAGHIIDQCVETFGKIDCLVNGAQQFRNQPIWDITPEDLDNSISVHLKGHFGLVHRASQYMMEQRSGSIVTITSRGLHGVPGMSPYAAVKLGILGATWAWAQELAEYGVRVNCVCPRALDSRETKKKPIMRVQWYEDKTLSSVTRDPSTQEEDQESSEGAPTGDTVAPIVVYLASDASDWVTGQGVFLSGDTLALISPPQYKFAYKPDGWSFEDLKEKFGQSVGAELHQPGMGYPQYKWYGGVR